MKIAICGSLVFPKEIKKINDELVKAGHEVEVPHGVLRTIEGDPEFDLDKIKKEKEEGTFTKMAQKHDGIRKHFEKIKKSDAILVVNLDKHGIENYIGGNTFLEMGFAHVLNKDVYLFNNIPDMIYTDEINTIDPVILNKDLSKIPLSRKGA